MQTMCRKCAENAVLLVQYSCDSGEDVHNVNVNKEEGMHGQREDVCRQCAGSAQRMRFRKENQRGRLRT